MPAPEYQGEADTPMRVIRLVMLAGIALIAGALLYYAFETGRDLSAFVGFFGAVAVTAVAYLITPAADRKP